MKVASLLFFTLLAGCSAGKSKAEHACSSEAALTTTSGAPITGAALATKVIALTFDDGPGTRTLELSAYLKSEGVRAVFFQNGRNYTSAVTPDAIIPQLLADGHLVGNHTQDHKDLATAFPKNADGDVAIVNELADTDALIAPFVANGVFLFRAPYGSFDNRAMTALQSSPMNKYVGTINWDIGGVYHGNDTNGYAADWDCWQNHGTSTQKCGDRYLHEMNDVGHGVVLMHDADYGNNENHSLSSGKGNTVDMVKYLVPILKSAGYTFVRADEIPAIAALLPVPPPSDTPSAPVDAPQAAPPAQIAAPIAAPAPSPCN